MGLQPTITVDEGYEVRNGTARKIYRRGSRIPRYPNRGTRRPLTGD